MRTPISIEGIGILCARGRGMEAFERALREGWAAPSMSPEGRMAYRIAPEDLMDREVLQKARRADRFSKLTVLAAHDAIRDSGLALEDVRKSTGIIVATAFGAHATIFKFLDDIIDYGELNVSPTTFAHSIHNAAAAYVASVLGLKGPAMTITQFHFAFHQALYLAYAWLKEGRVERVLLGVSDECSPAMEYICEEKLSIAADGKMSPLHCLEKPKLVPGEGSVFFLVTLDPAKIKYGAFSAVEIGKENKGWEDAGLLILGANAMAGSEKIYATAANGAPLAAYSDIYGGLMTSAGFECAAAALMLKNGPLRSIQCVSHSCEEDLAFIKIVKP